MSDFPKLSNNATGFVGTAGYTAGSGTLTLRTGGGERFPALTEGEWFAVTVIRAPMAYSPAATEDDYTIFEVLAVDGDVLTLGDTLEGTTDRNYLAGSVVQIRTTAGLLDDIHAAIKTNETSLTNSVKTTSTYANPSWLTSLSTGKLSGKITSNQLPGPGDDVGWDPDNQALSVKGDVRHDMADLPTPAFHRVRPAILDPGYPVSFNITVSSHVFTDPDYVNVVGGIEWNGLGGVPEIPGMPLFRDGWENKYLQSGRFQSERHFGIMVYADGSGRELRPITVSTAYMLQDGTPLDPFLSHRTDTWSTLSHLTEDVVQRGKKEWNPATSEWNQFSPGSALYLSPTTCSASIGDTGRTTTLKLVGTDNKLAWFNNLTEKHSIRSVSGSLYIADQTGEMASFNSGREFTLSSGPMITRRSGTDIVLHRWINDSATGGAGDWLWRMTNAGMVYLSNTTSGNIVLKIQDNKLGFFNTNPVVKPTVTGNVGDGTAVTSLLSALAGMGLIINSAA